MAVTQNNQDQNSQKPFNPNDSTIKVQNDFFEDLLSPDSEEDIIRGTIVPRGSFSTESTPITSQVTNRLDKQKTKTKSRTKGQSGASDVVLDSRERERLASKNITNEELKSLIREMPDNMLPKFIKQYVDYIVDDFGIDTRERFANFMGQVTAESIRGSAEYVYYTTPGRITSVFSKNSRFQPNQDNEFRYVDGRGDYGFIKNPWDKNGMFDTYYGGRMANGFNNESSAKSPSSKDIPKGTKFTGNQINPYHYTSSPDGYAYRGHGIIQITGIDKYKAMNEFFGKNGSIEKNDIDFLQTPFVVSENPKFAVLASLIFWSSPNNRILYTNKVSLETTRIITARVRGNQDSYQNRHVNTIKYYDWLLSKSTKSIQLYVETVSPSDIKFYNVFSDQRGSGAVTPEEFQKLYGVTTYSNLSYWESNGTPTPPYKDLDGEDFRRINNQRFPVFGITNNDEAGIYSFDELDVATWSTLKYACAGYPTLIKNGEKQKLPSSPSSFVRKTGRTAVGITQKGDVVIYVANSATLNDVQNKLFSNGCIDAINFDGGGSTFLFVDGKQVIKNEHRTFPTIMTWI